MGLIPVKFQQAYICDGGQYTPGIQHLVMTTTKDPAVELKTFRNLVGQQQLTRFTF